MPILLTTSKNARLLTAGAGGGDVVIQDALKTLTLGPEPTRTLTLGPEATRTLSLSEPSQISLILGAETARTLSLGSVSTITILIGGDPVSFDDTIELFQGESKEIPLAFTDAPGVPHDLSAGPDVLRFVVKESFKSTEKVLNFSSDDDTQIDIDAGVGGTATLKFKTSDTGGGAPKEPKSYRWMIYNDQTGGIDNPWGGGCFQIKASVDPA